jgi:hypothetical protein
MEDLRRCSKRQYSGLGLQHMLFRSNKPWLMCLRISRYSSAQSAHSWSVSFFGGRKSTEGGTVGIIARENYSPNQNKRPTRNSITLELQSGLLRFRRRPLQRKRPRAFLQEAASAKTDPCVFASAASCERRQTANLQRSPFSLKRPPAKRGRCKVLQKNCEDLKGNESS